MWSTAHHEQRGGVMRRWAKICYQAAVIAVCVMTVVGITMQAIERDDASAVRMCVCEGEE